MSLDQIEEELYPLAEEATPAKILRASPESRQESIERLAYLLAEQRGFAPGHELDDWLTAEAQFDAWNAGCACETERG